MFLCLLTLICDHHPTISRSFLSLPLLLLSSYLTLPISSKWYITGSVNSDHFCILRSWLANLYSNNPDTDCHKKLVLTDKQASRCYCLISDQKLVSLTSSPTSQQHKARENSRQQYCRSKQIELGCSFCLRIVGPQPLGQRQDCLQEESLSLLALDLIFLSSNPSAFTY